jgi:hypothetical protein
MDVSYTPNPCHGMNVHVSDTLFILGIKYEDLAYGAANGFATVGANNGKNGTSGQAFYNNPQTVIDFAWRS